MNIKSAISRPQIYAAITTLVVSVAILLWLMFAHLSISLEEKIWPPKHESMIELEEFVELEDLPQATVPALDESAEAYLPEPEINDSKSAPASGNDLVNQGKTGDAAPTVSSNNPSPVKVEKKPTAEELAAENKRREEEQIRRQTSSNVAGAFNNTGKNNANNGTADNGKTGSPSGSRAGESIKGTGNGRVGGGWVMPGYKQVSSPVTGSVMMTVKIDEHGNVTSVTFTGGTAPAGTDPTVRAACEKEVRSHRFTRKASAGDAPESATAYITYTFK